MSSQAKSSNLSSCYIISSHTMSCHITPCQVKSCIILVSRDAMSCNSWYHGTMYYIPGILYLVCHSKPHHVMPGQAVSCRVMLRHFTYRHDCHAMCVMYGHAMLCHATPCYFMSCRDMSCGRITLQAASRNG